jgi:hypothetical protein
MVGCDGKVLNITRMNSMRNHNWTIQAMILWNSGLFCGFLDDGLIPSRFEDCGTEVQGWNIWFQLDRVCKIKRGKERGIAEKWIFLALFIRKKHGVNASTWPQWDLNMEFTMLLFLRQRCVVSFVLDTEMCKSLDSCIWSCHWCSRISLHDRDCFSYNYYRKLKSWCFSSKEFTDYIVFWKISSDWKKWSLTKYAITTFICTIVLIYNNACYDGML